MVNPAQVQSQIRFALSQLPAQNAHQSHTRERYWPSVVPLLRPILLASRQAEPVADNDNYWPQGFADELIGELVAVAQSDPDGEFEFAKLEEMSRRAAVEITADLIADPREALGEEAWQRAAFEARLQARWGHGLDLAELVVNQGA